MAYQTPPSASRAKHPAYGSRSGATPQSQRRAAPAPTPPLPGTRRRKRDADRDASGTPRVFDGVVVDGLFRIDSRLGGGSFSDCYSGTELSSGAPVCFKIEDVQKIRGPSRLSGEYDILDYVSSSELMMLQDQGAAGRHVPRPLYFGYLADHPGCCVMVQELLGPSLGDLLKMCGGRFSANTTAWLAIQVIDCLQMVHERGYMHRDVKPQNFLIGRLGDADRVFACDFGLAKRRTDKAVPRTGGKPAGTIRYVSLAAHNGVEQNYRDDMEAVGYMLIHFVRGRLPWQDTAPDSDKRRRHDHIRDWKERNSVADLCDGCPQVLETYMHVCRSMKFDAVPNYASLRKLFQRLLDETGGLHTDRLDWRRKKLYSGGTQAPSPTTKYQRAPSRRTSSSHRVQAGPIPPSPVHARVNPAAATAASLAHAHHGAADADAAQPATPSPQRYGRAGSPPLLRPSPGAAAAARRSSRRDRSYSTSDRTSDRDWASEPGSREGDGSGAGQSPWSSRSASLTQASPVRRSSFSLSGGSLSFNSPTQRDSPPQNHRGAFAIGTEVVALFAGGYYPATIHDVNRDGTYVLFWSDNTYTSGVLHGDIKPRGGAPVSTPPSPARGKQQQHPARYPAQHSPTNGAAGFAPPSPSPSHRLSREPSLSTGEFAPGTQIEAIFRGDPFKATIYARDAHADTYTICWEDGSHSTGVSRHHIRVL